MIDIYQILKHLPHRYPILLVDRILEFNQEERRAVGLKNVSINEPYFQGHYPGLPIMPGVLILESMAQVGAAVLLMMPEFENAVPLIGAIDDVKFRRQVIPGDQLRLECEILWMRRGIGRMKGTASVDGEVAATMELTFKLAPRQE